jgi:hypothetical protein
MVASKRPRRAAKPLVEFDDESDGAAGALDAG